MELESRPKCKAAIMEMVEAYLDHLASLWEQMGLDDETWQRTDSTADCLKNALLRLIKEEEDNVRRLIDKIEDYCIKRRNLCRELDLPCLDEDRVGQPLLQIHDHLLEQLNSLEEAKKERMVKVNELKDQDERASAEVGLEPLKVPHNTVLGHGKMSELRKHVSEMKNLKAERLARYEAFKAELRRLYQRLDVEPQTSFEAKMVCDDDEGLIMSTKNLALAESALDDLRKRYEENKRACVAAADRIAVLLRRLGMGQRHPESQAATTSYSLRAREELSEEVKRLEALKLEHMQRFIDGAKVELETLWDQCYVGAGERARFGCSVTTATDAALEALEAEVERLKGYRADNAAVFNLVDQWVAMWNRKVELENREKDPKRLFDCRKNNLLQEEKDRRYVRKQLPKLERDMVEAVEELDRRRPEGAPGFALRGLPFLEFVEHKKLEHQTDVEIERNLKRDMKKEMLRHESRFGTGVASGGGQMPLTQVNNRTELLLRSRRAAALTPSIKVDSEGGRHQHHHQALKRQQQLHGGVSTLLPDAKRRKLHESIVITGNLKNTVASIQSAADYEEADVISSTLTAASSKYLQSTYSSSTLRTPSKLGSTTVSTPKSLFKTPASSAASRLGMTTTASRHRQQQQQNRTLRNGKLIPFKL